MTDEPDDIDRLIDANAAIQSLVITPEQRPGVRQFIAVAREMALELNGAELDANELKLAPVFVPPRPAKERSS